MTVQEPQPAEFFKAIRDGDLAVLTRMLDAQPTLVRAEYFNDLSPLGLGILCGRYDLVEPLLTHGADPNSAIMNAVFMGNAGAVRMLLDAGADPDTSDRRMTLLSMAAVSDAVDIVRILLSRGAEPNLQDQQGDTPIFSALSDFSPEIAGLLISAGADVNARDSRGRTPLFYAVESGMVETAKQLLDAGADPTVTDQCGRTALSSSLGPHGIDAVGLYDDESDDATEWIDARAGRKEAARLLIERMGIGTLSIFDAAALGNADRVREWLDRQPQLVNAVDSWDLTPIQHAASGGHTDVVAMLLANGAHIDSHSPEIHSPLVLAVEQGHVETAVLLLERGADIRTSDDSASTALHQAASVGCSDLVEPLIEHGADPNARDDDGNMPLHLIREDCPKCVRLLIDAGAEVNTKGHSGDTPLHIASDPLSIRLLINAGADMHARNDQGETPLLSAIKSECGIAVEALLEVGEPSVFEIAALGNLDMLRERLRQDLSLLYAGDMERHNRTLLHYAAETDEAEVAAYLLEQGIDAGVADDQGITPLHLAAESDGCAVAESLIAHGADANAIDLRASYTPLHEAAYHRNIRVAELLLAHGADVNARADNDDTPLDQSEGNAIRLLLWRAGGYYSGLHGC